MAFKAKKKSSKHLPNKTNALITFIPLRWSIVCFCCRTNPQKSSHNKKGKFVNVKNVNWKSSGIYLNGWRNMTPTDSWVEKECQDIKGLNVHLKTKTFPHASWDWKIDLLIYHTFRWNVSKIYQQQQKNWASGELGVNQPSNQNKNKKKNAPTPPKTNIAPENGPLEDEIPIGNPSVFRLRTARFREGKSKKLPTDPPRYPKAVAPCFWITSKGMPLEWCLSRHPWGTRCLKATHDRHDMEILGLVLCTYNVAM